MTVHYGSPHYRELGDVLRRQIIDAYPGVDTCIATARVTLDACRKLGVDAFAMPVRVAIVNDALWTYGQAHGGFPAAGDPNYPEGGWGVGVGMGTGPVEPNKWDGHLVVIAERRWLLDFSIDQASRPERGMPISEPLVAPVTEAWLRGREQFLVVAHETTHAFYERMPGNDGYKVSPQWQGERAPTLHAQLPPRVKRRAIR